MSIPAYKYPNYHKLHQSNTAREEMTKGCVEDCSHQSCTNITIIATSAIAGGVIGGIAGGGIGIIPGVAIGGLVGLIIVVVKDSIQENKQKNSGQNDKSN